MFYFCGNNKIWLSMKTVKLITCNDAMKAHILQGALENEGIESILHNENFSTLYKSCVSSIAGVDILVADELVPSEVMQIPRDKVLAIVMQFGAETSHSAIIIKDRNIPTILRVGMDVKKEYQGLLEYLNE